MTLLRELGSGERIFCLRPDRPTHVVSAYEIVGATSVEDWSAALGALQRRHPLLATCIRNGENGWPAFHAASGEIPLRVVPGPIPDDWEREMERELATPFALSPGPLLRAVLLHEPSRVILLLSIVHCVTDGMSGTFLMRDLLTALSGGALEPLPLLPSMETLLAQRAEAAPPPSLLPDLPAGRAAVQVPDDTRPCVTRRSLSPTLTATLRDLARREGTSVFGALCAAAVLARRSTASEPGSVIVSYPIDIRAMLGVGDDNLYLLSGGRMAFPPDAAEPAESQLWDLARAAREHVKAAVAPDLVRASIFWLEQQFRGSADIAATLSKFAAFFASDIHLTNLGQIAISTDYGRVRLEAGWGASLARWSGLVTIASHTLNERLSLTLTSHEANTLLLPRMERLLEEACAGKSAG